LQKRKGTDTRKILATAEDWSKQLASADTAEIKSLVQSLISRVIIYATKLNVHISRQVLSAKLAGDASLSKSTKAHPTNGHLHLEIKAVLKRCGGEVRLVLPANSAGAIPVRPRPSLIKIMVRAHEWYQRILRGELSGAWSISRATGLDERYVRRVLQCAFLAPDIVESILEGRQPAQLTFDKLRSVMPVDWSAQRQVLGFPKT
jgi:site-specific DNA recombinase